MPTYEYLCQQCNERLEVFQKFSDKPLRVHAECGGKLQKVFHASGVVFKGSGYYVTDSRQKPTSSDSKSDSKGDGKKTESKTETKAETKKSESKDTAKSGSSESKPSTSSGSAAAAG